MLARYPNAREIVWCQEEPQNQGAWYQIRHRLQELAAPRDRCSTPDARPPRRPATGIDKIHALEQQALVSAALHATATEETARRHASASDRRAERAHCRKSS